MDKEIVQLITKIAEEQKYDNKEDIVDKAKQILSFLEKSENKEDNIQYNYLLNKLKTEHSLKALIDFFYKRKKEERLRSFMAMTIQSKGKPMKNLKKKKRSKNDSDLESDEDEKNEAIILHEIIKNFKLSTEAHRNNIYIIGSDKKEENKISNFNKLKLANEKREEENNNQSNKNDEELEYKGKYQKLFNDMPDAYKKYLLSKELNLSKLEIEFILHNYQSSQNNFENNFNTKKMEDLIEIAKLKRNMGYDFADFDYVNEMRNDLKS